MVYFVQMEDDGPIWIGISLFPPEYLKAFWRGGCPELKVYGSFPGDGHTVRQIASELQAYRLEGDWFEGEDAVVECLERYLYIESYEPISGSCYPILWRDTADSETDRCPFCGQPHYHREPDGVCASHCRIRISPRHAADGTVFRQENGYLIKTRYIDAVQMLQDAQEDATH